MKYDEQHANSVKRTGLYARARFQAKTVLLAAGKAAMAGNFDQVGGRELPLKLLASMA